MDEKHIGKWIDYLFMATALCWTFSISIIFVFIIFGVVYSQNLFSVVPVFESLIKLVAPTAISSGVLIALLTFERQNKLNQEERERNHSKVFLDHVTTGFSEVLSLLENLNNNRSTWAMAANTLLRTQELSEEIKSPEYKKAYALEADRTRSKLSHILQAQDPRTGNWKSLPAQFFCGSNLWHTQWANKKSLDIILEKADKRTMDNIDLEKGAQILDYEPLAPDSIIGIYNFIKSRPTNAKWSGDRKDTLLNLDEEGPRGYVKAQIVFEARLDELKREEDNGID